MLLLFSDCAQQCLSVSLNNLSFPFHSAGITYMAALVLLLAKGYTSSKAPWDSGGILFTIFTALHDVQKPAYGGRPSLLVLDISGLIGLPWTQKI